eukprot:6539071-Prymnesium_polylepis.1
MGGGEIGTFPGTFLELAFEWYFPGACACKPGSFRAFRPGRVVCPVCIVDNTRVGLRPVSSQVRLEQ